MNEREAGGGGERRAEQRSDETAAPVRKNFCERRFRRRMPAPLFTQSLGQARRHEHDIDQGKRAGEQKGDSCPPMAEKSSEGWAHDETEAKSRADVPHRTGAMFRRSNIGDARLSRGDVAAARAVNDPSEKEHPGRLGSARNEVADGCSENAHQQDGLAPETIRQFPEHRRGEQLHERENSDEPSKLRRIHSERRFRVNRQHGNDDSESDHADEDGQKDDSEWRLVGNHARGAKSIVFQCRVQDRIAALEGP